MKVYFPPTIDGTGGKSAFIHRLKQSIPQFGVEITRKSGYDHDISLHVSRIKIKTDSKKVIRIDGVYHNNKQDIANKNRSMATSVQKADGVVYQSEFSRAMGHRYLGEHSCEAVIHNGADPSVYDSLPLTDLPHKYNFIAAAKWRPHKRLTDIIKSFIALGRKDTCLYIAGNIQKAVVDYNKYKEIENIKFMGQLSQPSLGSLLKSCTASMHLCWFDSCPNSVIEALVAGCPVISNNVGGTPEIVKKAGGIICPIDVPYNLEPVDLYHPPKINHRIVADAMNSALEKPIKVDRNALHIDIAAHKYSKFFRRIL